MDSGWAVVFGAAIATIGSVLAPWVTAHWSKRADDRRELLRLRGEVVGDLSNIWVEMAVLMLDQDESERSEQLVQLSQQTITRLAIGLQKGDSGVLSFAYWVTATAIPEAPDGTWVPVAHWASKQLFEWNWGDREPGGFSRDMAEAASYQVG